MSMLFLAFAVGGFRCWESMNVCEGGGPNEERKSRVARDRHEKAPGGEGWPWVGWMAKE